MPVSIVSDHDSRLTVEFWGSFQATLGTSLRLCSTFHPQTDVFSFIKTASFVPAQLSLADGFYTLDIRCPDAQYGFVGGAQVGGDF